MKRIILALLLMASQALADKIVTVPDGVDPNTLWGSNAVTNNQDAVAFGTATILGPTIVTAADPSINLRDTNATKAGMRMTSSGGTVYFQSHTNNVSGSACDVQFTAMYNAGLSYLMIKTNGNVGIGTSIPQTMLDIVGAGGDPLANGLGASNIIARIRNGTSAGLTFGVYTNGTYGSWIQTHNTYDTSQYPLYINPMGGNVGIGTVTASSTLTVNGTIAGNGSGLTNSKGYFYGEALQAPTTINITNGSSPATIQAQIDAVPRNLNKYTLTFNFAAGTYTNNGYYSNQGFLVLQYFYGGFIYLVGPGYSGSPRTNQTAIIDIGTNDTYAVAVRDCASPVYLWSMGYKGDTSADRRLINVQRSHTGVYAYECYFVGTSASQGYLIDSVASFVVLNNCYFNGSLYAINSSQGSTVYSQGSQKVGTAPANGYLAYGGLIIRFDTNVVGTTDNVKLVGGQISLANGSWF